MATQTIQGLINVFKDIVDRHYMINDYFVGPQSNIGQDRSLRMPYLWLDFEPSTLSLISGASPVAVYSFQIAIMDIIDKGDSNYNDLLSDTDAILNTVLVTLSQSEIYREKKMSFFGDIIKAPAQQETDDNVNGWVASVSIRVPLTLSECTIPIEPPCDDC